MYPTALPIKHASVGLLIPYLVPVIAVLVTVLETFAVVTAVQLTVAKPRAVIICGIPVSVKTVVIGTPAACAISASFLRAVVKAGIQSGLPQVIRAAPVWVAFPVAAAALSCGAYSNSNK